MARRPTLSRSTPLAVRRAIESLSGNPSGGTLAPGSAGAAGSGGSSGPSNAIETVPPYAIDFIQIPGPPQNVQTSGGLAHILITWGGSGTAGIAYYEIFRHTSDLLSAALKVRTSLGFSASDSPPHGAMGATFYYWVRGVNKNAQAGPFNAAAGTPGSTAPDPEYMLEVLTGQIKEGQLFESLNSRINMIDDPASGLSVLQDEFAANLLNIAIKHDQLHDHRRLQESVNDAIIDIDPATGVVSLKATANVTTDVEVRVRGVELEMDAVAGVIASQTYDIEALEGSASSQATRIEQLEGEISLTASAAYVAGKVGGLEFLTNQNNDAAEVLAPEALLQMAVAAEKIADFAWQNRGSLAVANQEILTKATELEALAQIVTTAGAALNDNIALLRQEMVTRATADSVVARSSETLWAELLGTAGGHCIGAVGANAIACELAGGIWAPGDGSAGTLTTPAKTSAAIKANNIARIGYWKNALGAIQADKDFDEGEVGWTWHPAAALAEASKQVQVLLPDGSYAAVQDQMAALTTDNGLITAQRTIKTETRTSDGKVVMASIGAMTNSDGDSEILLKAGRVAIVPDDMDSADVLVPFVVGTFADPVTGLSRYGVFMNGAYVVDLTAKNFVGGTVTADHVKVTAELVADQIKSGLLEGIRIRSINPGDPYLSDPPQAPSPSDYSELTDGELIFYKGGAPYKYMRQVEIGSAKNGEVTAIGAYDRPPKVQVSIRDLPSYMKTTPLLAGDISLQNQRWDVRLDASYGTNGVNHNGNGFYSIKSICQLTLDKGNTTLPIGGATIDLTNDDTDISAVYTSPANTTKIVVEGTVKSKKGTGTAPNWYSRYCDIVLQYRLAGSGAAYTSGVANRVYFGTDPTYAFGTVSFSAIKDSLPANSYEYRVSFAYGNMGPTFSDGGSSGSWVADADTNLTGSSAPNLWSGNNVDNNGTFSAGSFSLAAGKRFGSPAARVTVNARWGTGNGGTPYVYVGGWQSAGQVALHNETISFNLTTYNGSVGYGAHSGGGTAEVRIDSSSVVIKTETFVGLVNLTTILNSYQISQASYTLSAATVLDGSGSVNWIAIA